MNKDLKCLRCGHEWYRRFPSQIPVSCPSCKSYEWRTARKSPEVKT